MGCEASLRVDYVPLADGASAQWEGLLGIAAFDGAVPGPDPDEVPIADVRTPVLGPGGRVLEVWRTEEATKSGQHGRIRYRHNDGVLFGTLSIPESASVSSSGLARADTVSVVGSDISFE